MNVEFLAITAEFLGKILIVIAALRVHKKVKNEHKIDKQVFRAMNKEVNMSIAGIILWIIAYFLQLAILF